MTHPVNQRDSELISRRPRVADEVTDSLRRVLLEQELLPGDRLLVADLAQRFGVSPTPVREALSLLEAEGLVAKRPRQGYVVGDLLDRATLESLYALRLRLEPWAAGLAATHGTTEQIGRLDAMCGPPPSDADVASYHGYSSVSDQDLGFHRVVADASGNVVLGDVLGRLAPKLRQFHAYHQAGATALAWTEHRAITDAIVRGDAEAAEAAMTAHLRAALERIRASIAP
ncbi:GntR family transcriptional regulator [Streptomyces sp. VNUA24]|uniref:GntR family transcriptional regulator n=1 Tax=Streptomyces sp. VNUA24 TaxID=3031131 RepID=UPI0023B830C6|nr:GntR family transcriptional regulator [Streptomyces sp. VNUA24]WEH12822.1 GntR family transcriptional regulator [Streptomyces sp. VNUA24]